MIKEIIDAIDIVLKSDAILVFLLLIVICVISWVAYKLYLENKATLEKTRAIITELTKEISQNREIAEKQTKIMLLFVQQSDAFKDSNIDLKTIFS